MAKRRKKKAKRPGKLKLVGIVLRKLAVVAFAAGIAAAFGTFLLNDAYLSVSTLRVAGAQQLDPVAVAEQTGVTRGDNILFVDVKTIQENIERLPYVEKCDVFRLFPNVVVVELEERWPVATLIVSNRCYLIDNNAVVLRELEQGEDPVGPFITRLPKVSSVTLGQPVDSAPLREALDAWQAFCHTTMAKSVSVSEIAALHPNDLRMYCDDLRYEMRWGRGEYERQARRLDILWAKKRGSLPCDEYLDLRFGTDFACK